MRAKATSPETGITPACAGSSSSRHRAPPHPPDHPPHARGAARRQVPAPPAERITPACAGSSADWRRPSAGCADHPRMRGEQPAGGQIVHRYWGSPPHARGAGVIQRGPGYRRWITPACAGSRRSRWALWSRGWDHPRMRGEQHPPFGEPATFDGSPPHARGAGWRGRHDARRRRITPACAGSRTPPRPARRSPPDHPPHARGADDHPHPVEPAQGITPACAGSRVSTLPQSIQRADHPRMRGEQLAGEATDTTHTGSPPHARGAVVRRQRTRRAGGITPACAGSRAGHGPPGRPGGDHPRMRGEQARYASTHRRTVGSPPHARGAAPPGRGRARAAGITPACAGSRPHRSPSRPSARDHPRMRGEQASTLPRASMRRGSPPHARGAGSNTGRRPQCSGITPACAGSSGSGGPCRTPSPDHPRMRGEQHFARDSM